MEENGDGLMEAESNNELSYGSSNVVMCVCHVANGNAAADSAPLRLRLVA